MCTSARSGPRSRTTPTSSSWASSPSPSTCSHAACVVADGIPAGDIDDATIDRYLYTTNLPDPDLIIRTSGEYRLSNFLVWQSAYSELYFSPVLWPEFGPDDLEEAVRDFSRRERRFGNISAEAARATREGE